MTRLYAIQSADVPAVWPHVEAMLAKAVARSVGDVSLAQLREDCLERHSVLLVVATEAEPVAAATAHFTTRSDGALVCTLRICGGTRLSAWRDRISDLEDWARHRGAVELRVLGRPGWRRIMRGYRDVALVALSKDL